MEQSTRHLRGDRWEPFFLELFAHNGGSHPHTEATGGCVHVPSDEKYGTGSSLNHRSTRSRLVRMLYTSGNCTGLVVSPPPTREGQHGKVRILRDALSRSVATFSRISARTCRCSTARDCGSGQECFSHRRCWRRCVAHLAGHECDTQNLTHTPASPGYVQLKTFVPPGLLCQHLGDAAHPRHPPTVPSATPYSIVLLALQGNRHITKCITPCHQHQWRLQHLLAPTEFHGTPHRAAQGASRLGWATTAPAFECSGHTWPLPWSVSSELGCQARDRRDPGSLWVLLIHPSHHCVVDLGVCSRGNGRFHAPLAKDGGGLLIHSVAGSH